MLIEAFLSRVRSHPHLELVHRDSTMCMVAHSGPTGERTVRLGLWAVRRLRWEQIAEALHVMRPVAAEARGIGHRPAAAMVKRVAAPKSS